MNSSETSELKRLRDELFELEWELDPENPNYPPVDISWYSMRISKIKDRIEELTSVKKPVN